jgi:hypothetical protein
MGGIHARGGWILSRRKCVTVAERRVLAGLAEGRAVERQLRHVAAVAPDRIEYLPTPADLVDLRVRQ